MVFVKRIRLALVGMALLLSLASPAQASFDFSPCAANCVQSSGCNPSSEKCVCRDARSILLDSVISCLFFNCKTDLREFDSAFLSPVEAGCEDSNRDIPSSKLKAAESLASSYISKLTPLTTSSSPPSAPTPPPKTTSAPATTSKPPQSSRSSTTTSAADSSSTSLAADDESTDESTSSSAEETTAAPTRVVAPSPATQLSSTSSRAPSSNSDSTNPFGASSGAAGSAIPSLLSVLGLPLAIVGMLAAR
ncbi:hypothetical protein C8A05DRAFT_29928 [Staphylotrichum tortipilum]|uniref:Extracellular membrane protein CFEM domain-containing protein n=1 Tax=Staphylotrichum tortipilum TaxID=2831512 RepID=A0AAN6MSE9_9PEZI|nr:hypothetical protein C8A05DRAFT_29928 [Staphylotrichum longicolle]